MQLRVTNHVNEQHMGDLQRAICLVYQGAQMTLLTMDLVQQPAAGTFAGFTLEYTGRTRRGGP
jgi:hypothetical protein